MGKNLITVFVIAMLVTFALPVSAMQPNAPQAPDGNPTPMLGAAGPNDESGMPPMPNQNVTVGAFPTSVNDQITDSVTQAAPIASRAQLVRERIASAIRARNATVNATMIKSQIMERAKLAVAVKAQDLRQTESFLLQARQVIGTLNATQKRQLANVVYGFVNSSLENRVQTAYKLEQRGIDPEKVAAYNASVEALKAQIMAANSTQERRMLVNQANREWATFKKDVVKEKARDRLVNATDKAQVALDRINELITKLSQNGTDTSKLVNISARVQNRIDAARQQNNTLRQMEWRLAFARDGLAHLAAQVKRVIKAQAVEELAEQAEPAELAVDDPVEAETEAVAETPTPAANATESQ